MENGNTTMMDNEPTLADMLLGYTRNEKKEKEELETIEKIVWSICFICKEEYSKDILMNEICLHSYCKKCIEQSASTSKICPVCHISLPSLLPINYTLLYWRSLSSLYDQDANNENNDKDTSKETQQNCEDCEEHRAEVNCNDCKTNLCATCCDAIHSRRSMKNHSISPITSLSSSSKLPLSSHIISYSQCVFHPHRVMELYCAKCNECICVDCIDENHSNHSIKTVFNRVENIKEKWKKNVSVQSKDIMKSIDKNLETITSNIYHVNKEINATEEKLKSLIEKKENMIEEKKLINKSKVKVNQTTAFLFSFLQSLPPLPFSSYFSVNDNLKIKIREGRIREFFEKEKLFYLFTSLLSQSRPNNPSTKPLTKPSNLSSGARITNIFGTTTPSPAPESTQTNIFGTINSSTKSNIFGTSTPSPASTPTTNIFSTSSPVTTNIFGTTTPSPAPESTPTNIFGTINSLTKSNIFGTSTPSPASTPTTNIFVTATPSPLATKNIFGTSTPSPTPTTTIFGTATPSLAPTPYIN